MEEWEDEIMIKWFTIEEIEHGWFHARISHTFICCSDYLDYDMPAKMLDKIARVVKKKSQEEGKNARKFYEYHWMNFPDKEFACLKDYAFELEKQSGEYDGMTCVTFLQPEGNKYSKRKKK